jgi:2-keto-4-pentenoate hydratase
MSSKIESLAALLFEARRSGRRLAGLAAELVPDSVAEAYQVQDRLALRLGKIAGWKVGAPSPTAEPSCAPLFAAFMAESPARFSARDFPLGGIEGELAFRFGSSLPPRAADYTEDEVWQAVETLHPAIELVDSRFTDFRAADKLALLADNQSNGAFCYGPALRDWRAVDFLRQPASLSIDGQEVAQAVGGNAAGHPRRLLHWLANHCSRRGRGLAAGDIVTTGTHTGLAFAKAGSTVMVRFPAIGEACLVLAD